MNCSCEYQCDPDQCCVDGQCVNDGDECDTSNICCDGTCMPKCTETKTANCNQIDDIPCPPCFNFFWKCNDNETEISLDAPIYYCSGGCPGDPGDPFNPPDCDWEEIDCTKKYECMNATDYLAICEYDYQVGKIRCVGPIGWDCYECEPNPTTVQTGWTLSKECK